jgi:hypothetical protein
VTDWAWLLVTLLAVLAGVAAAMTWRLLAT